MSNATGPNTTSIESRARYACMNGGNVSSITGKVVKLAREADAEIERLRARVAELEPDANAFRAMVNLQMYIGFRQGTVEAFSDGILAASVFNLGHDALSAARNAIADHATALNECSKKADDALAKDGA